VGCFDVATGNSIVPQCSGPTYTSVFGNCMIKLAEADPRIVAVTAAMPEGTGLSAFAERFPDRFFDVGIAEQHGVTFAAGLATEGFRPVVAIYSTFLQRAYDQIIHDVCIENLPVVFAIDRGGLVGEDGPTHHGQFDLSYLRSLPNMTVMAPMDENELCMMLEMALQQDGPTAIRYPRGVAPGFAMGTGTAPIPYGKAQRLTNGGDLLILAIGRMVHESMVAHDMLRKAGIEATVVNCRFVKPFDADTICALVKEIPWVLTIEENALQGGFGSAVAEALIDRGIAPQGMVRMGIPDRFIEHGAAAYLLDKLGLDASGIARQARKLAEQALRGAREGAPTVHHIDDGS